MFQTFVGKTIKAVDDTSAVNHVTFYFTDGSKQGVYAECGSSNSIPFFDFDTGSDSEDENQDDIATMGQLPSAG